MIVTIHTRVYFAILCSLFYAVAAIPFKFQSDSSLSRSQPEDHDYEILRAETVYKRWRSITQQKVKMPNGNVVDYDIIDQEGAGAVIIFAWNSKTKSATIIKEYNPGCHKILCGPAAGIIETDPKKHGSNPDIAARDELEEECHLSGGIWHRLVRENISIPMDKYVRTGIVPYLVIDPVVVDDPKPLDAEEDIVILENISASCILDMIYDGKMNLVGGWACMLAIEKLRDLGEI